MVKCMFIGVKGYFSGGKNKTNRNLASKWELVIKQLFSLQTLISGKNFIPISHLKIFLSDLLRKVL